MGTKSAHAFVWDVGENPVYKWLWIDTVALSIDWDLPWDLWQLSPTIKSSRVALHSSFMYGVLSRICLQQ